MRGRGDETEEELTPGGGRGRLWLSASVNTVDTCSRDRKLKSEVYTVKGVLALQLHVSSTYKHHPSSLSDISHTSAPFTLQG
ncbi:hypothetical protein IRJ41_013529 [Triplophysa rosa]|uniref:Uncharacterized protein n=1 Tax=Triplophysa rosa TaxID=992332 RepID=A0A9W7WAQ8_TRIRA|nr:hypothetical protein IRJ41_013529 [Triplophysa rosa]